MKRLTSFHFDPHIFRARYQISQGVWTAKDPRHELYVEDFAAVYLRVRGSYAARAGISSETTSISAIARRLDIEFPFDGIVDVLRRLGFWSARSRYRTSASQRRATYMRAC